MCKKFDLKNKIKIIKNKIELISLVRGVKKFSVSARNDISEDP